MCLCGERSLQCHSVYLALNALEEAEEQVELHGRDMEARTRESRVGRSSLTKRLHRPRQYGGQTAEIRAGVDTLHYIQFKQPRS
jgi:hypothetical protein